jgi:hypothetical protein
MTARYPFVRVLRDILVVFMDLVALLGWVLVALLGIWIVVSPWIILGLGGWRLFLRLYLLPYVFVLVGLALIMMFLNQRELLVRVRDWRAERASQQNLRKAA